MAFNEKLADRVREMLAVTDLHIAEIKMFSGLCFMVNDKMCVGVQLDSMMVRLNPESYDSSLEKEGCRQMDMAGKIMKGFVLIDDEALQTKKQLSYWINLALEYNKIAMPSKKKKKKT
ncbi:MAG: TfoX/Sxy family protein [Chitinophagaceae bacterium]